MSKKQEWAVRIKVLVITAVIASIGNMLSTWHAGAPVMPWETIPALASMFVIVILGCLADELMRKIHISLPKILYISLFTMLLSIPGFSPIAEWMQVNYAKIGVLPLCTPILAYAGISIGKDMDSFKKQGLGIVLTSLMAFAGTYIGSAIIAEVLLKLTHVI
ncbi:MAG: DUF340 domain-containing protein [Clostridiaceae bacterium]|jgi:hypothetical protein|nr:DUF340 domain-containing protein [Clostridiaceae bacterium]